MTTCDCESYDCRGECCGLGNCSCSGEYFGAKIDAIMPDGVHWYWSTHCRHADHAACSASDMPGTLVRTLPMDIPSVPVLVHRAPAQCKHCSARCICPCHKVKDGTDG